MPEISSGQKKRISRITRRAIPAVQAAYRDGRISARMADTLLYLGPKKQKAELERRLSEVKQREARHRLAATAISEYLDNLNGTPPDLHQLAGIIKGALESHVAAIQ
jgi:hypothetical protein